MIIPDRGRLQEPPPRVDEGHTDLVGMTSLPVSSEVGQRQGGRAYLVWLSQAKV